MRDMPLLVCLAFIIQVTQIWAEDVKPKDPKVEKSPTPTAQAPTAQPQTSQEQNVQICQVNNSKMMGFFGQEKGQPIILSSVMLCSMSDMSVFDFFWACQPYASSQDFAKKSCC